MNNLHTMFACLFLLISVCNLQAQEVPRDAIPNGSGKGVTADLRIRESIQNGQRHLALITTLVIGKESFPIFNPFGNPDIGRPYRVVLTDAQGKIVHTVIKDTSTLAAPQNPAYWVKGLRRGLVGRCFWTHKSEVISDSRHSCDLADMPSVAAGRYSLIMLVTGRMFHDPPRYIENAVIEQRWLDSWNNPELDQPRCASTPVMVDVDDKGVYRPLLGEGVDGRFESLESDALVDSDNNLSITTRLINPSDAWLAVPGMNIYETREYPVRVALVREDGVSFHRFSKPRGVSGQLQHPLESHCVLVPRDGVIGGTLRYAADTLAPGKYQVTTEIDESIYKDKLFVDGKRVIRKPGEWPIVFRSRTTTITVPEKAP